MRTITFGEMTLSHGHNVVSTSRETKNVVATFTSSNYLQNAAHVHMSPSEARHLAMLLIEHAAWLDPIEGV
jgi:hypothetical protein